MRNTVRALIHGALLACGLLMLPAQAHAQTWPSRPIKLVVPTGPGAATDVMARLLGDGVSRTLGQTVVVENQPGASGILAHQTVARAAPDGYTFLFTNTSGMIYNPISFKQLPYDPLRDFTPVASVCSQGPQMVSVNAERAGENGAGADRLRQGQSRQALDRLRRDRRRRRRCRRACSTSAPISASSRCLIAPPRRWRRTPRAASTRC